MTLNSFLATVDAKHPIRAEFLRRYVRSLCRKHLTLRRHWSLIQRQIKGVVYLSKLLWEQRETSSDTVILGHLVIKEYANEVT